MAVKTVQAVINGTTYTLTENTSTGAWEATITAPSASSYTLDGHYYPVTVTATDEADNSVTVDDTDATLGASLQLQVVEKVAPVITISAPTSGELTSDNTPTISFTITDDDSGVDLDSVVLKVDDTEVTGYTTSEIDSGYSFEITLTDALDDGEHTITVDASDNDGNAATTASVTFEVLATAPTLSVTEPTDGVYTNSSTVTVSGTTDAATITVTVDDGDAVEVTISDGAYSTDVTLTGDGEHTITITATSKSGVTSTITRTVNLDTVAPTITAVTLTPNPVDAGATYIISVTVTD